MMIWCRCRLDMSRRRRWAVLRWCLLTVVGQASLPPCWRNVCLALTTSTQVYQTNTTDRGGLASRLLLLSSIQGRRYSYRTSALLILMKDLFSSTATQQITSESLPCEPHSTIAIVVIVLHSISIALCLRTGSMVVHSTGVLKLKRTTVYTELRIL